MSLRAVGYDVAGHLTRQQDLHRSPSQPSLTHTVTTEQSEDRNLPTTPYATSIDLDSAAMDGHGHLLPKGAAPARPGATSSATGSWGRTSVRSVRKMPSVPSRSIPEFVAPPPVPTTPSTPAPTSAHEPSWTSTDTEKEKRKSKRLSLTRSLHDLRERRAADKARKRASTTSEKLPSRVPDLPPELPPVPAIPSMYKTTPQPAPPQPTPTPKSKRFSLRPRSMKPPPREARSGHDADVPPVPPLPQAPPIPPMPTTPKSSGFSGFIRKLTSKKSKPNISAPTPGPPIPYSQRPENQRAEAERKARRQTATTMPAQGAFGSIGRKTRLDNIPQVEAPKSVRGMLSDMKDESGSIQRRNTVRQSLVKRVPVPRYSPEEFEPIINPRDLPAPPEAPVEIAAAAEARADAFARLVGSRPAAPSIKSMDSGDSRRVRAPVPPPRTNSPRSRRSTPASKSGSDMPVTPPPEAMDVFTASSARPMAAPIVAAEVCEEPMSMGDDRPAPGTAIELKAVQRYSVTSQVVVIGPDKPAEDTGEALYPPKLNIETGRGVSHAVSPESARAKVSYFSEDDTDPESEMPPVAPTPVSISTLAARRASNASSQHSRPAPAPLIIPVPTVGGAPIAYGSSVPRQAQEPHPLPRQQPQQPQPFMAESPTDFDSFGHGFIPPRAAFTRQDSSDDFHSAYGHGSVFGSDASHSGNQSPVANAPARQAVYGVSRSDVGHSTVVAPYNASQSDIGHGYSARTARMFSASASRSDLGHGASTSSGLTQHPFIANRAPDLPRRQMTAPPRSPAYSRSDVGHGSITPAFTLSPMASRSDLGHGMSPAASRSDLTHTRTPVATRSDIGHAAYAAPPTASHFHLSRANTLLESPHALSRSQSSKGSRQVSQSDHGHGSYPLAGKRSVPDLRRTGKASFPDLRGESVRALSRQNSDAQSAFGNSLPSHHSGRSTASSHRMLPRQGSLGDISLRGAGRRLGGRKPSYDDFGVTRGPSSSHGHGSVSGHGHESEDFHSALDHSSMLGSSIGHGSWLHEDPRATPTPRTPRTPRTPKSSWSQNDPRLAGSSPAREAPIGDGIILDPKENNGRTRLRSLTRRMSKKKQPPTSYDAYHEKQVELLTRRKSCKPTLHSEASLAAEIHSVADDEDKRLMEAVFMA